MSFAATEAFNKPFLAASLVNKRNLRREIGRGIVHDYWKRWLGARFAQECRIAIHHPLSKIFLCTTLLLRQRFVV